MSQSQHHDCDSQIWVTWALRSLLRPLGLGHTDRLPRAERDCPFCLPYISKERGGRWLLAEKGGVLHWVEAELEWRKIFSKGRAPAHLACKSAPQVMRVPNHHERGWNERCKICCKKTGAESDPLVEVVAGAEYTRISEDAEPVKAVSGA